MDKFREEEFDYQYQCMAELESMLKELAQCTNVVDEEGRKMNLEPGSCNCKEEETGSCILGKQTEEQIHWKENRIKTVKQMCCFRKEEMQYNKELKKNSEPCKGDTEPITDGIKERGKHAQKVCHCNKEEVGCSITSKKQHKTLVIWEDQEVKPANMTEEVNSEEVKHENCFKMYEEEVASSLLHGNIYAFQESEIQPTHLIDDEKQKKNSEQLGFFKNEVAILSMALENEEEIRDDGTQLTNLIVEESGRNIEQVCSLKEESAAVVVGSSLPMEKEFQNSEDIEIQSTIQQQIMATRSRSTMIPSTSSSSWDTIPPDLMNRVLSCLPFPTIFQLRCVCKYWDTRLECPYFLQTREELCCSWGSYFPVVYITQYQGRKWRRYSSAYAFDASLNMWQQLPTLLFMPDSQTLEFIAGAGGRLLCCKEREHMDTSLIVCNPVTKSWRQVPPPPSSTDVDDDEASSKLLRRRTYTVLFLVQNDETRTYKIILAGLGNVSHCSYRITKVYDSRSDAWTTTGKLPPALEFKYRSGAFSTGVLYWWANEYDPSSSRRNFTWDILVAYDVEQEVWNIIPQTLPVGFGRERSLLGGGRRLLIVGKNRDPTNFRPLEDEDHGIFELNPDNYTWLHIAQMPKFLTKRGIGEVEGTVACGSMRNKICMISKLERIGTITVSDGTAATTTWTGRWIAIYDTVLDSWQCVPCKCFATTEGSLRLAPIHNLLFEPNLMNI